MPLSQPWPLRSVWKNTCHLNLSLVITTDALVFDHKINPIHSTSCSIVDWLIMHSSSKDCPILILAISRDVLVTIKGNKQRSKIEVILCSSISPCPRYPKCFAGNVTPCVHYETAMCCRSQIICGCGSIGGVCIQLTKWSFPSFKKNSTLHFGEWEESIGSSLHILVKCNKNVWIHQFKSWNSFYVLFVSHPITTLSTFTPYPILVHLPHASNIYVLWTNPCSKTLTLGNF